MLRQISLSVLATLTIGSGQVYAQASPSLKSSPPPSVTTVLPASTPGVVLINTTAAWAELDRFNPYPVNFLDTLKFPLAFANLDFEKDIQPWLGDRAAIALMPVANDLPLRSSAVLLVPVTDANRFNAFLGKVKTVWGSPQIERDYKGVTLMRWTAPTPAALEEEPSTDPEAAPEESAPSDPSPDPKLRPQSKPAAPEAEAKTVTPSLTKPKPRLEKIPSAPTEPTDEAEPPQGMTIALLPNAVALATQDRALEKLIDARTAEKASLAESPLFQRTLNHPQFGRSLVVGYGNLVSFAEYLPALINKTLGVYGAIPPLEESQIAFITKAYNAVDTYFWVQPEGLHGQTNFYFTTPKPEWATPVDPNAHQVLGRMPGVTFVAANSRNLKQQWQRLLQTAFTTPESQKLLDKLRVEFRKQTNLDLEADIINWMDGDYAAFYYPTKGGLFSYISPQLNLGIGLIFQTSDRPTAEALIKKLEQAIRKVSNGEAMVVPRRIKGQPITSWEGKDRGKTQSILAYGWVSNDTLLITTGAGAMTSLVPTPYQPLSLNSNFQTATASFPIPNEGYVYVNMGATLSFIYGLMQSYGSLDSSPFMNEFQRAIGTIRSVSSSNSTTAEAQRVDSLWVLSTPRKAIKKTVGEE